MSISSISKRSSSIDNPTAAPLPKATQTDQNSAASSANTFERAGSTAGAQAAAQTKADARAIDVAAKIAADPALFKELADAALPNGSYDPTIATPRLGQVSADPYHGFHVEIELYSQVTQCVVARADAALSEKGEVQPLTFMCRVRSPETAKVAADFEARTWPAIPELPTGAAVLDFVRARPGLDAALIDAALHGNHQRSSFADARLVDMQPSPHGRYFVATVQVASTTDGKILSEHCAALEYSGKVERLSPA